MAGGRQHKVRYGESVASIARRYGVAMKDVWDHPSNASLRQLRNSPDVLAAGDDVFVPDRREKTVGAATGDASRFKAKIGPSPVRLRLTDGDTPRAGVPFVVELEGGRQVRGKTDGDGYAEFSVPTRSTLATLAVESAWGTERYRLRIGDLDPSSEVRGVQQRLHNLGYECPASGVLDDATRAAIGRFQDDQGLARSAKPDGATVDALVKALGA